MKSINRLSLNASAHLELAAWQADIDLIADYRTRIETGSRQFDGRNRIGNTTLGHVRDILVEMCNGNTRCMYCEDSCADQIEHFWPRTVFPDKVFVWLNYLYGCGRCNLAKLNSFEIYHATNHHRIDVTPKRSQPRRQPPPVSSPVLIDPTVENPADFLWLHMTPGSFIYEPKWGLRGRDKVRAEYTINLLGLNRRPELPRGRAAAYRTYLSLLRDYINEKATGASISELSLLVENFHMQPFQAVWSEMKRQLADYPDIRDLFNAENAALNW